MKNNIDTQMMQIKKNLKSDLIKYGNNIAKNTAKIISDILTQEAFFAIEDFYNQYEPKYYYRHMNFRKSFKRSYKNRTSIFSGGVELLEDSLPDVYSGKNSKPESVFWRVYLGYHGIASLQGYTPIMKPSPIQRLYNRKNEILNNQNKYTSMAEKLARGNSYIYLFN